MLRMPAIFVLLAALMPQTSIFTASAHNLSQEEAAEVEEAEANSGPLRPNVPPGFDPSSKGLSTQPLILEDLGVALYLPTATIAIPQRVGGQLVVTLTEATDQPTWSLTLQHFLATTSGTTAKGQIETHLAALREAGRTHRVIHNEAVTYGGSRGWLCYIKETRRGDNGVINGWLILPIGDDLYLVFALVAMPDEFPLLRPKLEEAFATISIRSAMELADRRVTRIEAGRDFLASLTPERLRELVGLQRWSRIYYRPDADGEEETEVGYVFMEVLEGKRGGLNPERSESDYTQRELTPGLIVRMQGSVIGDLERNLFYDSISTYWISWDGSEEAWDVRGTQRHGTNERTEAELGIRTAPSTGEPRPLLTVVRHSMIGGRREVTDWAVPDVYLSQAIAPLLPMLLPMDASEPVEYAWYFYNVSQATPQLTQRTDRWSRDEATGNWVLLTRLSADGPPTRSMYGPDRKLIRSQRADGVIIEPTTLQELTLLWQRKGLPIRRSPGRR